VRGMGEGIGDDGAADGLQTVGPPASEREVVGPPVTEVTRGRNLEGTTGAGGQASAVGEPAIGSGVPMVGNGEPDSHKKSKSVRLDEAASGKLSSSKTT
jgi:hypothetical protein